MFRLAGSGWYETDFKSDKEQKRNLAEKGEAEAPKGDSKPDVKVDAKPESKPEPKPDAKAGVEAGNVRRCEVANDDEQARPEGRRARQGDTACSQDRAEKRQEALKAIS